MFRLGSLFSGSGGFELAGAINGIEPVWASEIEPYPIKVTRARFPQMKHLGSVLDVSGAEVEPVDIITFGSPCQDLSVAGKQAGLHKGERSNLFFEAIRIIKEMRESTNGKYPRIAVWENVPGAYSSNKGEDFRAVLEAFAQINDEAADVPRPASGKWNRAGAIVGNGWSIAWRTFDAQFWGVPQRRKRIYLIADFGSERAGEILFEQKGVRGDFAESGKAGEETAGDAKRSVGRGGVNGIVFKERAGCPGGGKGILCGDKPFTLSTMTDQAVCYPIDLIRESGGAFEAYEENAQASGALKQSDYKGAQVVCYALEGNGARPSHQGNGYSDSGKQYTLNTIERHAVCYSVDCRNMNLTREHGTLQAKENGGQSLNYMGAVCYPVENHLNDSRVSIREDGIVPTLSSRMGTGGNNGPMVMEAAKPPRKYIIRRLTPLECCRLQGFPDDWCSGLGTENPSEDEILFWAGVWETHRKILGKSSKPKSRKQIIKWLQDPYSDSAKYKMWGNGIALPNAVHVVGCAKRLIGNREVEG